LKHKDAIEAERLLAIDPVVDVVDGSNVIAAEPTSGSGPGKSLAGRNRVKGPNPLSVKKKKAPAEKGKGKRARDEGEEIDGELESGVVAAETPVADGRKRKRRRKKGIVAEAIEEIERDFEAKAAAGGDGDSD
jgi:U3 small nucleolar RNA-associated protein 23